MLFAGMKAEQGLQLFEAEYQILANEGPAGSKRS